jgi:hypothetical protein
MAKSTTSIIACDSHAPSVDVRSERHIAPTVVHAISILHCLDAQMRRVEPEAKSLADMDRVTRGLTLPGLEELIRCLNRALTLIGEALK